VQRVFHGLVDASFGDPGLYIEAGGAAALFDCGHLMPLAAARIHRVRDVFITHAHVDHFFGFDWLLRTFLGADRRLRVFGPAGIAARIHAKLDAYTWNIAMDFSLEVEVHEVAPALDRASVSFFRLAHGLERRLAAERRDIAGGVLAESARHRVLAAEVDHGTPALAFRYEQRRGLRIDDAAVRALGLARGPWLKRLRSAVLGGRPAEEPFEVPAEGAGGARRFALGELARAITAEVRGTTIAYVADTRLSPEVRGPLVALAADADAFYCEAKYLEEDRAKADATRHLTARDAASLAREAGARALVLFHPSPKYQADYGRVLAEARAVFPAARFQEAPGLGS
jgi:ribonuclease Z